MRKIQILAMIAAAGCALLAASSCNKEQDAIGQAIVFRSSTTYDNGPFTRTSYSGVVTGGKERINWEMDDRIRIYSDVAVCPDETTHYADYKVTGVTEGTGDDAAKSTATIATVGDGGGLEWGSGTHNFYCVYPSPDVNSNVSFTSTNVVSMTLPTAQTYTASGTTLSPDMDYAYMYAAVQTSASSSVNLAFKPMFTAFQFTVDSENDATMTITDFTLSSATLAMSGTCTAEMTSSTTSASSTVAYTDFPTATDANKKVTVSFNGGSGITITKGSPITFTVFALPRNYSDLTISFTTSGGDTKTLELKDASNNWVPFAAAQKYSIAGLGLPGGWIYTLSPIDDIILSGDELIDGATKPITVYSYKQRGGVTAGVSWKAKALSTIDGETYVAPGEAGWPEWLDLDSVFGSGGFEGDARDVVVDQNPLIGSTVSNVVNAGNALNMIAILQETTPVGTESAPRDLSLYDIYGDVFPTNVAAFPNIKTAGSHTANCYVVSAPGWYCFPLVYGNAIDPDQGDPSTKVNSTAYLSTYFSSKGAFNNCNGTGITSPYILTDLDLESSSSLDAAVVWQDVVNYFKIIRDKPEVIDAPEGAGLSCKYIRFYIAPENILPGNIMIALRDTEDENKILWSWHIWVSAIHNIAEQDDFVMRKLYYRTSSSTSTPTHLNDILGCNLGWTPPLAFNPGTHTARSTMVKIIPDSGTASPVTFTVSQPQASTVQFTGVTYSNTFYQWGRKDPFLPGVGNVHSYVADRCVSSDYMPGFMKDALSKNVSSWIQQPYVFDTSSSASIARTDLWTFEKKTIFDPCPAGFCVPNGWAFTGFTNNGGSKNLLYDPDVFTTYGTKNRINRPDHYWGYRFSYNGTSNESTWTIYIPCALGRDSSGKIVGTTYQALGQASYWTNACSSNTQATYFYAQINAVTPLRTDNHTCGYVIRPVLEWVPINGATTNGQQFGGIYTLDAE